METFLDIKKAFEKVPDKVLENLHFATGEGSEETIELTCYDEGEEDYEFPKIFELVNKKYSELKTFAKLVKNVGKAQEKLDEQEDDEFSDRLMEEGITSETFKMAEETETPEETEAVEDSEETSTEDEDAEDEPIPDFE